MADHIARRTEILAALVEELLGPGAARSANRLFGGNQVHRCEGRLRRTDTGWHPGEEILVRDRPAKRYGVGVLSPPALLVEEGASEPGEADLAGDGTRRPLAEAREKAERRRSAFTEPALTGCDR